MLKNKLILLSNIFQSIGFNDLLSMLEIESHSKIFVSRDKCKCSNIYKAASTKLSTAHGVHY